MKTLSTGYLVLRGVVTAASLLFGIYDILTGDALGWPITICGVILTGFLVLRIWLARRIRLSKADSGAEPPARTDLLLHLRCSLAVAFLGDATRDHTAVQIRG